MNNNQNQLTPAETTAISIFKNLKSEYDKKHAFKWFSSFGKIRIDILNWMQSNIRK